jgi:hypothetical protein
MQNTLKKLNYVKYTINTPTYQVTWYRINPNTESK